MSSINVAIAAGIIAFAAATGYCQEAPTGATSETQNTRPPHRRPNVVLIVADDLGYGELGAQGNKQIPTPHIDSIAKNGIRFTQGYVTCPVCAPSRIGLLTGRYQNRIGFEMNPGPKPAANYGIPAEATLLPEYLNKNGYRTGMVGKWHLGLSKDKTPTARGFDSFFGFLGGAHAYLGTAESSNTVMRGNDPVAEAEYLTAAFGREAVSFIDQNSTSPFFLYLPFNALHTPLQVPEERLKKFAAIQNPKRRMYAAMTSAMDDAIGGVLKALDRHHLDENTMVVFLSDNGGPTAGTTSSNGPLRAGKSSLYEGGIRVPFFIQWKGQLPANQVYEKAVSSLDFVPTVLAATQTSGGKEAAMDGVNLLPYLRGENVEKPHETLYWRFINNTHSGAMRDGDWKVVTSGPIAAPLDWELYNLADDIGEKTNLASQKPELLKELTAKWEAWDSQMAEPAWVDSRSDKQDAPERKQKRKARKAKRNG